MKIDTNSSFELLQSCRKFVFETIIMDLIEVYNAYSSTKILVHFAERKTHCFFLNQQMTCDMIIIWFWYSFDVMTIDVANVAL